MNTRVAQEDVAVAPISLGEAIFECLSRAGSSGMLVLAPAGNLLFANPALAHMWNLPANVRHARDIWARVLPQITEPGTFLQTIESLRLEGRRTQEWRVQRCDGRYVECFGAPLSLAASQGAAQLLTFREIDPLHEPAEHVRRLHHLAALGRASVGIGHELRNFLIPATAHARFASDELSRQHPAYEHVAGILRATQRCHLLLEKFIKSGRDDPGEVQPHRIGSLIENMFPLLRAAVSRGINIETDFTADTLWVEIDPAAIEQLILNLVLNAAHAIESGRGTIAISVAPRPWMHGTPAIVRLSVRDDGIGFDRAAMDRVAADGGFTGWRDGEGCGIGLSIVREIVARHRGEIHLESTPGAGTAVHIDFPTGRAHSSP